MSTPTKKQFDYYVTNLNWGDGTPSDHTDEPFQISLNNVFEHEYAKPGLYTITGIFFYAIDILNKKSIVGNTISSSREGLIYRYRLNENYKRNEEIKLIDANKNYNNDYTKTVNLINCGSLYSNSNIDVFKFSQRSDGYEQQNDNKVLIRPTEIFSTNLNYQKPSAVPLNSELNTEEKRKNNKKIVIERSPVDKIDAYILNQISDFNISDKFADPQNQFKSEYDDLNTFRDEVLTGVKLDINTSGSYTVIFIQDGISNIVKINGGGDSVITIRQSD